MREKSRSGGIIAFLTDFGSNSPFPGIVKGVIKGISPGVDVIDIFHDVPPGDVGAGAFLLTEASDWFPPGTVFLAVVDPGVGGDRKGIAVETENYLLVGPDNGLLYPASEKDGVRSIREISNREWMLPRKCETFHGRDVFGPVAARLAAGGRLEDAGPELGMMVKLEIPGCEVGADSIGGECLWVDRFGNVITSIPSDEFLDWAGGDTRFLVCGKRAFCVKTFGFLSPGQVGLVPGSFSRIEIVLNMDSASAFLGITRGDPVRIERLK